MVGLAEAQGGGGVSRTCSTLALSASGRSQTGDSAACQEQLVHACCVSLVQGWEASGVMGGIQASREGPRVVESGNHETIPCRRPLPRHFKMVGGEGEDSFKLLYPTRHPSVGGQKLARITKHSR